MDDYSRPSQHTLTKATKGELHRIRPTNIRQNKSKFDGLLSTTCDERPRLTSSTTQSTAHILRIMNPTWSTGMNNRLEQRL
eukprot:6469988-Amphidinium_carterae.5